jgi:hypothetical protein
MLAAAGTASAECSGVVCTNVAIQRIWMDAGTSQNGDLWIQTDGTEANLSCTPNNNIYLKVPYNAAAKKDVYAMLMMAFSMGKPVSIGIVPASADCVVAYAFINN